MQSEARLREVEMALQDNSLALRSSLKRLNASSSKVESLESQLSSLYGRYLGRSQAQESGVSGADPHRNSKLGKSTGNPQFSRSYW